MSKGNSAFASWLSAGGGSGGGGGGGTLNFISVTKAALDALIGGGALVPGSFYKITDRGDQGILVQATSANTITQEGVRYMLCPATYAVTVDGHGNDWMGVWNASKSANVGQLAIWGGLVWQNTTGNIGSADDAKTLDAADWTVITKAANPNSQYIPLQFSINYDYTNDWIDQQCDQNGNVVGQSFGASDPTTNPCDLTDWNMASFPGVSFAGNIVPAGVYNNVVTSDILYNSIGSGGPISGNNVPSIEFNICQGILNNAVPLIRLNSNKAIIDSNTGGNIFANSNNGSITSNAVAGGISANSNIGDINDNSNTGAIDGNSNLGAISLNTCVRITNNSNSGIIDSNHNTLHITGNTNQGDISGSTNHVTAISGNSNNGAISDNANTGTIDQNANNGAIAGNLNIGSIFGNSNNGSITSNNNLSSITQNTNNGAIQNNADTINLIGFNANNGHINNNLSSGAPIDIVQNVNNGYIQGTFAGSVTDPQVNKT